MGSISALFKSDGSGLVVGGFPRLFLAFLVALALTAPALAQQPGGAESAIEDPRGRHWAEVSLSLPLDDIDEADEDTLNRILWHAQKGRDDTYPAWAVLDEADED